MRGTCKECANNMVGSGKGPLGVMVSCDLMNECRQLELKQVKSLWVPMHVAMIENERKPLDVGDDNFGICRHCGKAAHWSEIQQRWIHETGIGVCRRGETIMGNVEPAEGAAVVRHEK